MDKEATCKGSYMFGTACGLCSKCEEELANLVKNKKEEKPSGLMGWRCPICGAGNPPFAARCICVPMPELKITC